MSLQPGSRIGHYEIVSLLGSGGMGEVYRARDPRLDRDVAIKMLSSPMTADAQSRERFDREAKAVAAFSHPNIVAIHDVGHHDGAPYAAMELLDGETLRRKIEGHRLSLRTAVDYAVQIGRGLAAAHDRGIVHRDLKPDNIFVTRDGQLKILDFGLAGTDRRTEATAPTRAPATQPGTVMGTVGYMSPEQVRGERAGPASDMFSFGCVLFEMVAGQRAFGRDGDVETMHAILKDQPANLLSIRRETPPSLDRVIARCLEKDPSARFHSAADLVFALENLRDVSASAQSLEGSDRPHAWRRYAAVAAAFLVAGVIGVVSWQTRALPTRPQPEPAATASNGDDARRVVAVLPFQDITPDGSAGYFGAGMTEEVTSQLAKISALRVVSRAAAARFTNVKTDLAPLATQFGVGSVVSGSVREQSGRVRVNVELIETHSGQLLWSEQYDRDTSDVFAVQSDIALRVSDALKASVTLQEQARVGKPPTSSLAAYQLFVRGRSMTRSARAPLIESLDLLKQAVALDPKFALAYTEMAIRYGFLASFGEASAGADGLAVADKAIAIDPQLAQGHHGLAVNLFSVGRLRESTEAFRKAVALDPKFDYALNDIGVALNAAGKFDEALPFVKQSMQLNPSQPGAYYHVGLQVLFLDDDTVTERFLGSAATRFPSQSRLQILLAQLDFRRSRSAAALDRIRRAADQTPKNVEVLLARSELATLIGSPDASQFTEPLLGDAANAPTPLLTHPVKLLYAYQLFSNGQRERATPLLNEVVTANEEAIKSGNDTYFPPLQSATVYAIQGDLGLALHWLERAVAAGWRDARTTRLNPMWKSLRGDARFELLVKRMEADVAAMRARADYSGLGLN